MDCFVKKIKGIVTNDNLLRFGEIVVGVKTGSSFTTTGRDYYIKLGSSSTPDTVIVDKVENVTLYNSSGQELTLPVAAKTIRYAYAPNGGKIHIMDKFNFTFIEANIATSFPFDEDLPLECLRLIGTSSCKVDLEKIGTLYPNLEELNLGDSITIVNGNIGNLAGITDLQIVAIGVPGNWGNISTLAELPNIISISTGGSTAVAIMGDVKLFCESQWAAGRRQSSTASLNTLTILVRKTPCITFGETVIEKAIVTFGASSITVACYEEFNTTQPSFTMSYDGSTWTTVS